jgi:IS30 family transposase
MSSEQGLWSLNRTCRQSLPRSHLHKGTSSCGRTRTDLDEYITEINNRPRKIPASATPNEVFQGRSTSQDTQCCTSN